jgi:methylglutamate dehydrogenase subunit C
MERVSFRYNGRLMHGLADDTLAAALLRNGERVVARSFKYHRPRGILSAGVEEPNALVTVGQGAYHTPNTRATDVFIYEGMRVKCQNAWPHVHYDMGSGLGLFARFLSAGFYYKTFFGSARRWIFYEKFIRRAAGLGTPPQEGDADRYRQRAGFCDILIVGGGYAGLSAALAAVRAGKRVVLVEQDRLLGRVLLSDTGDVEAMPALQWIEQVRQEIITGGGRILPRTTCTALAEDGSATLVQILAEPGDVAAQGAAQILWHMRAGEIILATGALERPLAFAGNDTPGVMLSRAMRVYAQRFGIAFKPSVLIATNNDDAYATAQALHQAGVEVVLLDSRCESGVDNTPFPVYYGAQIVAVRKSRLGKALQIEAQVGGVRQSFKAHHVAMSGGFTPNVQLYAQAGGALEWSEAAQAFLGSASHEHIVLTGDAKTPPAAQGLGAPTQPLGNPKKTFIDFQNDVTLADIDLAWVEGYRSVEHLKRYTTLGMATDQGKTSNIPALQRFAALGAVTVPEIGHTRFRPPYTPVSMGAYAGGEVGVHSAPRRRLALHAQHDAHNPLWYASGYWHRPRAYMLPSESLAQAALREARMVRTAVGLCDVSTLAKFMVQGPDAAAFLERVCATTIAKLNIGRGRYTIMLREDGMVFDDGTAWRLGETRYLLTSSTGGAARMTNHISYVRHVLCPHMRVSVVETQEHYAALALAGPHAKAVLAALGVGDIPRHMSACDIEIGGAPVLLLAASFSGERAFELHFNAAHAPALWNALLPHVLAQGGGLYGLEAMDLLRLEKGHHLIGTDIDGRLTPHDLGFARMLNPNAGYIGWQGLLRPALSEQNRLQFVGMESLEGAIPEGAMLVQALGGAVQGHVTSSGRQVLGEGAIALGHVQSGFARMGEELIAHSPTRNRSVRVRLASPHFYDPKGEKYRD